MKIKMTLLSDTIFGNGNSIPGGEDISVLCDDAGFPYMKGSTFKGIFREELINYLVWEGKNEVEIREEAGRLLGESGDHDLMMDSRIRFSDFHISNHVKQEILREKEKNNFSILPVFSFLRTFTALDETGLVDTGSLRYARCLMKGLVFYGEIFCQEKDTALVQEVLGLMKYVVTMRNRGFGAISLEEI